MGHPRETESSKEVKKRRGQHAEHPKPISELRKMRVVVTEYPCKALFIHLRKLLVEPSAHVKPRVDSGERRLPPNDGH